MARQGSEEESVVVGPQDCHAVGEYRRWLCVAGVVSRAEGLDAWERVDGG